MKYYLICLPLLIIGGCGQHFSNDKIPEKISIPTNGTLEELLIQANLYNDNALIQFKTAMELSKKGDLKQAVDFMDRAIILENSNPQFHYFKAQLLFDFEDYKSALKSVHMAIELGHPLEDAKLVQGIILFKKGEWVSAKASFDSIRTNYNHELYYWKGLNNLQLNDTIQAVQDLNRSIELKNDNNQALISLAKVYNSRKQLSIAQHYLDLIDEAGKKSLSYLDIQADYQLLQNNLDSALFYVRRCLKNYPLNYDYYYRVADIHYYKNEYDSVEYYCRSIPNTSDQFASSLFLLARTYDKWGKYEKSMENYQQIIELDTGNNLAVQELEIVKRKVAYLWQKSNPRQNSQKTESTANDE